MSDDVDYPQGCQPIVNSTNVSQQVERLRKLAGCLYDCKPNSSEEVQNPQRFQRLFYHLSQDAFLENSNTDFRIYLSLCLANILRVYHPEIPTATTDDLKDVYIYIFRTLRGLGDVTTDSPKFKNYFHLVEAIEKILHPITEMTDDDEHVMPTVLRALAKSILQTACGKGWRKNVQNEQNGGRKAGTSAGDGEGEDDGEREEEEEEEEENAFLKIRNSLINMVTIALSETERVPYEVLDVFFHHIIEPQKTQFREACLLAQHIISNCIESADNSLSLSIREVMGIAVKEAKLPDEFEMTGSNSRQKYFELLRSLHNINYDLVCSAVSELNFWLQSENEKYRKEAVTIVGLITRMKNCRLGMDPNDVTWSAFINAASDLDEAVRLEFVEQSKHVLMSTHSHLRGHVINCLLRLSTDSSETIRSHVVRAVTTVAKSKLEVISDKMLKACADRMRDKKQDVRIHAIKSLMDLYHNVMTGRPENFYGHADSSSPSSSSESSLTYTESDKDCVRFIPTAVFHVYRITQKLPAYLDSKLTIERYIQLYFIPYKLEPEKRVQLMYEMFRGLDDIGTVMFGDYVIRSSQLRRAMIGILCLVSQAAEQSMEGQLKERIRRIVQIFPDASNLERLLFHFVNMMAEDERVFNGVKRLVADNYTSSEINSASSFILSACSKNKLFNKTKREKERTQANVNEPDVTVIFRHFINRITPVAFDVPSAKEIVRMAAETVDGKIQLKKSAENSFERDLTLLKVFTEHFAHLFIGDEIIEKIRHDMMNTEEPKAVEAALISLSKIFSNSVLKQKISVEATRKERWFLSLIKDLKDMVLRTEYQYRRSCKLATRLLSGLLGTDKSVEFFDGILDELLGRLQLDAEGSASAFQVVAEIFRTDPLHFFPQIMDVIEAESFGTEILSAAKVHDEDPIEFNELMHMDRQPWPILAMTKVYAAKFATKVLISYQMPVFGNDERKRMERTAQTLIEHLGEIIEKKGDLGGRQCDVEKARLRAAAASCLLKIASVPQYRPKMDTQLYKNLCYLIIDEAHCVRQHYGAHVKKELGRRLPIEFAACYGLVNLGLTEEDGENRLDGFKAICLAQMQQAFAERTEERANAQKLEGVKRAMFCSETVIAYVVWLLANYAQLEKVEENAKKSDSEEELERKCANVNLLAELQESLWHVIDSLKSARCNMQSVWRVLEKLKTCGDKPFRTDRNPSNNDLREHNKKLWALSDLGITMMLYRAKLQNEDQDTREAGYNLQFFFLCTAKDKADPSNVYAPDILITDEKQRNGKSPKAGRKFHVGDLTAGFSPPPPGTNETTTANASKNSSRKGANTTTRKRAPATGRRAPKRRSGSNAVEIEDDDEEEEEEKHETIKSPPKPRGGKRGVYEPPENEEDEIEEVMPLPKRRGGAAPSATPSSSNGTTRNGNGNGTGPPRKRNSRKAAAEVEIEESDEEEEEEKELSLDQIVISPILNDSGRARRSTRTATLTASTPMVPVKPKIAKRKREEVVEEEPDEVEDVEEEEAEEEEDVEEEAPAPKKRNSGGRRAPPKTKTTKKKTSPVKKASPKKKTKVEEKKKNQYGLPMEEDEEEQEEEQPPPSAAAAPKVRTRNSARLSKK